MITRPAACILSPVPLQIRIVRLQPRAQLPARATDAASGFDLHACLDAPIVLQRHPQLVPTGLALETPAGFDVQVRPRSGLSLKGVGVAFGTIDADYRGEILVTMWTFGDLDTYALHDGDRIAQLVVATLPAVELMEVSELSASSRGVGGHGSTGR
jgi:dUTP pyrophosphatase